MSVLTSVPVNQETKDCEYPQTVDRKRTSKDFTFIKQIGEGSYSGVYLAVDIHNHKQYAIKVCDKSYIIKEKKTEYVKREKEALQILGTNASSIAPYFPKLFCSFQDKFNLYFAMTYAKNGNFLSYIERANSLDINCTQFYAAELLLALEHMHTLGIIHRDIKPENILLDSNMHILVTDFGSAKIIGKNIPNELEQPNLRSSFVGTAQYISPEVLSQANVSGAADLWALGCIIYEMLTGCPPFKSDSEFLTFNKIQNLDYKIPEGIPLNAKDLITKLLVTDPKMRIGASDVKGYPSIRSHDFFYGLEFDNLALEIPPHIKSATGELFVAPQEEVFDEKTLKQLEPGFDDKQLARLLGLSVSDFSTPTVNKCKGIMDFSMGEMNTRLTEQEKNSKWHPFVEGNLILKCGLVDKRKGLFQRRRMFLLTTGPHLYYVDPLNMALKGEIPWSEDLRVEGKNFKTFFIHTPNRTYFLEDPQGSANEWCKAIEEVKVHTYGQ